MQRLNFVFFLFTLTSGIFAQTAVIDTNMWIPNAKVSSILVDGDYTYIGGDLLL